MTFPIIDLVKVSCIRAGCDRTFWIVPVLVEEHDRFCSENCRSGVALVRREPDERRLVALLEGINEEAERPSGTGNSSP